MKLASLGLLAFMGIAQLGAGAVAQPITRPVKLGFLAYTGVAPPPGLIKRLQGLGYEEGKNLIIEFRSADNKSEDLGKLAAELVSLKPDVLIGSSTPSVLALKKETASMPIVMTGVGVNPITMGWVQSFAHPGGNLTGFYNEASVWITKTLQLATEILPGTCCFLVLRNPANPAQRAGSAMRDAASSLGIELKPIDAATPEQMDQAFEAPLDTRFAALYVGKDFLFGSQFAKIAAFAQRRKLAMFTPFREGAKSGALLAFDNDADEEYRVVATYVDKILKGAAPAELPIQQPTKFVIVINLKTAKTLGITIPESILGRADELIE
jgi:putative tryptophan/tyrosine transport system substrate-binding protein